MSFNPFVTLVSGILLSGCVVITIPAGSLSGPAQEWPESASCPSPPESATNAARLVALMNVERAKAGVGPLHLSAPASSVAHAYACEIAARRDIGHHGSDGSSLSERLARAGVHAHLVAENTGEGFVTPEEGMRLWMASPGHRKNILRAGVSQVGIGQAGGNFPTWVTDFVAAE